MKLFNKEDFLKQGVCLYCKGIQWSFEGLYVKLDTIYNSEGKGIDFRYINLCIIDSESSNDLFDKLEDMLNKSTSEELNQCVARDGTFSNEDIFMVYEPKDISKLFLIAKILCQWSQLSEKEFKKKLAGHGTLKGH